MANYQTIGVACGSDVDCILGPGADDACCDDPCGLLDEWINARSGAIYKAAGVVLQEDKLKATWWARVRRTEQLSRLHVVGNSDGRLTAMGAALSAHGSCGACGDVDASGRWRTRTSG